MHIHQVETDYSWALMQSVLLAFNREHITSYLERAFDICTGKKTQDDMKPYTVLHMCSAHILKAVRQAISKQTDDQGLRDFVTFAFARLQNVCSLAETRHIFSALCSVLTTPKSCENVKASLQILESVIAKPQEGKLDETMEIGDTEKWDCEDRNNATTIVGSSPFIPYFRQIFEEAKEHSASQTSFSKDNNPYFCPGIIDMLFDHYLAIFPMWSGLLLRHLAFASHDQKDIKTKSRKTRDTNCHVEKWFGIVKQTIMKSKKKLRPGTFIRKMHCSLQTRYT